jgi:hypothetical protein
MKVLWFGEFQISGVFIDANNLYGFIIMHKLPIGGFEWIEDCSDINKLLNQPCILEFDIQYPKERHELHKDYPLAPERFEIARKQEKLCQTLFDKKNHVVHYDNLKYYVEKGLKVTKVHRTIKFKELDFLKSYIDKCIDLRKKSKTEMEKTVWKLMINSVFGKTMENLRKRVHVEVVIDNPKRIMRLHASSGRNGNNHAPQIVCATIEPNTGKIPYHFIHFRILKSDGS